MLDRGRREELLEVALAGGDEAPVGDVTERREDVPAEDIAVEGRGRSRPDCRHGKQDEQRREKTAGAAKPEADEIDPPIRRELTEQQSRDEEPGEHEEEIDAKESAAQRHDPEVIGDHHADCDRPHSVEGRDMGQAARARRGATTIGLRTRRERGCRGMTLGRNRGLHRTSFPFRIRAAG